MQNKKYESFEFEAGVLSLVVCCCCVFFFVCFFLVMFIFVCLFLFVFCFCFFGKDGMIKVVMVELFRRVSVTWHERECSLPA